MATGGGAPDDETEIYAKNQSVHTYICIFQWVITTINDVFLQIFLFFQRLKSLPVQFPEHAVSRYVSMYVHTVHVLTYSNYETLHMFVHVSIQNCMLQRGEVG